MTQLRLVPQTDTAASVDRRPVVALVGAPNCGKTSLFNALTGGNQRVGNYSGVTVERKSGIARTPEGRSFELIDLPGTQSLRARSLDEEVTRDVVMGRLAGQPAPDLVLAVVDATHLRIGLRLVQELAQTGRPVLMVLNMIDLAMHRGIDIDVEGLSAALGVPVIASTAVRRAGMAALWARLDRLIAEGLPRPGASTWTAPSASETRASSNRADQLIARFVTEPGQQETSTTRIDRVLLHPVAGLIVLLALLFVMFQAVFAGAAPVMDLIDAGVTALGEGVTAVLPPGLLQSFLVDGVISGVGSVIIFLPQILILFLFILLLEDLGYMARAAFLMDRIMGGAGLHGRAFIPLLSSFACAIPGIMAARVIDDRRDRLLTILVAPLMTCSARIPVYTLLISAFVPQRTVGGFGLQGLVMFGLYAVGIVSALLVSAVAKRLFFRDAPSPPLLLDLPDYKLPRLRSVLLGLWLRVKIFLRRAGTTIFAMVVLIWVLSTFPYPPPGATEPAITYSYAATLGNLLLPILAPLGFNWQISVALIPGMAAREVAVAALGTVYAVGGGDQMIGTVLAQEWTLATALSLLVWYIFAPQCLATLAVIRREAGGAKWAWISFGYMFALAWMASFAMYHAARAMGWG